MNHVRRQRGFTLWEVVFAVFLLGILSVSLSPTFTSFLTTNSRAYAATQLALNQNIANAVLQYSANAPVPPGTLPSPCSSSANKLFFMLYNSTYCAANNGLSTYLQQQGVPLSVVTNDGSGNKNIRVYQTVPNNSYTTGLFYQGGPTVTLSYDLGVIYTTNCGFSATCNQTSATASVPPASVNTYTGESGAGAVAWKSANLTTWTPGQEDVGVAYLSTLPIQLQMLQATANQLTQLKTSFQNYYNSLQAATPASTANFYPFPTGFQIVNATPNSNQGCRDGWYALDAVNSDILTQIGIQGGSQYGGTTMQYGRTAWGGSIDYCRDYDPLGTKGYGVSPHFAALRFNALMSSGLPSDTATIANNQIISF